MNTFDIILLGLLLFGFIRGLMKGLFVEMASLVSLLAGVYGAIHFSYFVGNFLENRVDWEEKYISIVAFAITFIIIVVVIALLGKLFTKIADFASLGIINKILGGVFGALKIGLILSVLLIVFDKLNSTIPFINKENTEDSVLYKPVKNLAPMVFPNFLKVEESE
ncbi:CvpA family protein [Urechidicola croceus]|uniref:Colicin V production protein n=1 Tax=Urechidicola croceus TaxID=1850246 RepID=A0A1D8P9N3_9FLAO|nr:CvpA family protein [Urechidicola croceus]AOW21309.1 colicin V production protein [Urechidicola croceus]